LINPGKYEEAATYFGKFMTSFFDIEGYAYKFSNWSTIEEAMESIGETVPSEKKGHEPDRYLFCPVHVSRNHIINHS
jgi:hypothetical protein